MLLALYLHPLMSRPHVDPNAGGGGGGSGCDQGLQMQRRPTHEGGEHAVPAAVGASHAACTTRCKALYTPGEEGLDGGGRTLRQRQPPIGQLNVLVHNYYSSSSSSSITNVRRMLQQRGVGCAAADALEVASEGAACTIPPPLLECPGRIMPDDNSHTTTSTVTRQLEQSHDNLNSHTTT